MPTTRDKTVGATPIAAPAPRMPVVPSSGDRGVEVHRRPPRNPGAALDLDWALAVRVNRSAVERRAATLPTRRTVKKQWQAAWLLRAVTCMDLTTLQGDDTPGNVRRLCAKARQPLQNELIEKLGIRDLQIRVGAVCVYHLFVETAVRALRGFGPVVGGARQDGGVLRMRFRAEVP